MNPSVLAVHASGMHTMSKHTLLSIMLIEGLGVEGDAHRGSTAKHGSRVRANPTQPNLRQVHLIHSELFDELRERCFETVPGMMGENITTANINLLTLPTGTFLNFGERAVVEITGLRNPCSQLDGLIPGLMGAVLDRDEDGEPVRKSGVMGIVVKSGEIQPGDRINVELPSNRQTPLKPV